MIADRTYRPASFLAARVKRRLRFAAHTGPKARRVLARRPFRLRGQVGRRMTKKTHRNRVLCLAADKDA
jgi:hypothetical protein